MKVFVRRYFPLLVIATLACVYAVAGGDVTSCEGGCFRPTEEFTATAP